MMLRRRQLAALGMGLGVAGPAVAQSGWQPQRPVQFIVPAGTGGGADQMARVIQGIVSKHSLMNRPLMVVNKAGGAGAEGFLEARNSRGNPHVLIISLSNLFTTPMSTGIPFTWRDLTPIRMMALDEFVLWVHAESPWQNVAQFVEAELERNPLLQRDEPEGAEAYAPEKAADPVADQEMSFGEGVGQDSVAAMDAGSDDVYGDAAPGERTSDRMTAEAQPGLSDWSSAGKGGQVFDGDGERPDAHEPTLWEHLHCSKPELSGQYSGGGKPGT
jgi:hypothetical protein